jgi:hypothetical protein
LRVVEEHYLGHGYPPCQTSESPVELLENKGFLLLPVLPVKYRTMLSGCRAASDRRVRAQRNDWFGIGSPEEGR